MKFKPLIWFSLFIFAINQKVDSLKLKYTLAGHNGTVRALATVKNRLLASGSDDYTIRIWDLDDRKEIYCYNSSNGGHSNQIRVLLSLRDNYLASASLDGTVKIWWISENPKLIQTLGDPSLNPTTRLALTQNILISGYGDGSIKIWDISNLDRIKLKYNLKNVKDGHSSVVTSLLVLDNNQQLVSTSTDKTVKIWNINEGTLDHTFDSSNHGHENPVGYSTQVNDLLVTASYPDEDKLGDIKVWDLNTKNLLYSFNTSNGGHQGYIFELITLKNFNYVASASDDKTVKIWDVINGRLISTLEHKVEVWILINLEKGFIVSGAGDYQGTKGELDLWDLKSEKLIQSVNNYDNATIGSHQKRIYSFLLLDNTNLISGSVDKTIKVWDLN